MSLNTAALSQAANEARGLSMDAVQKAASGHLGLPLGCAELGNDLLNLQPLNSIHSVLCAL